MQGRGGWWAYKYIYTFNFWLVIDASKILFVLFKKCHAKKRVYHVVPRVNCEEKMDQIEKFQVAYKELQG